ncbi:MAG: PCRF domain-containing protein [Nocardioides sp.]
MTLSSESSRGTHRVQRIPVSEKRGRRHSSTVAVAWLDDRSTSGPSRRTGRHVPGVRSRRPTPQQD